MTSDGKAEQWISLLQLGQVEEDHRRGRISVGDSKTLLTEQQQTTHLSLSDSVGSVKHGVCRLFKLTCFAKRYGWNLNYLFVEFSPIPSWLAWLWEHRVRHSAFGTFSRTRKADVILGWSWTQCRNSSWIVSRFAVALLTLWIIRE